MNICKRCGKQNPAEIHTCSPKFTSYRQAYLIGMADGAEGVSRWIRCSEKLPENKTIVLIHCPQGIAVSCFINGEALFQARKMKGVIALDEERTQNFFISQENPMDKFEDVDHWMPLPEPPNE